MKRVGSYAPKNRNTTVNISPERIKHPKNSVGKKNTENCENNQVMSRTNKLQQKSSKFSKNTKQFENIDNSALRSAKIYQIIDESE